MVKKIIIVLCLILPSVSSADVAFLEKGKPAPFTGHLIDSDKARIIIEEIEKKRLLEELSKIDLDIIEKQSKSIENLKNEYNKVKNKNELNKYIYFGLGVLTTGLIVKITK